MGNPNHTHTIFNLLQMAAENQSAIIPHRLDKLAELLGFSRPTSDKILKQLEEAGMIRFIRTHPREIYLTVVLEKDCLDLWMTFDKLADDLRVLSGVTSDEVYLDSRAN